MKSRKVEDDSAESSQAVLVTPAPEKAEVPSGLFGAQAANAEVKSDEPAWIRAIDDADREVKKLGSLRKDGDFIEFNQFLKIMEISSNYGKGRFSEKKEEMLKERRQARARNDETQYEKLCMEMTQRE